MSTVTSKDKATAVVFAVVATALLIEVGFRLLGPDQNQFNNVLDVYPDNPRGYFDRLSDADSEASYGVPMDTAVGLGGRRGQPEASATILGLGDSQAQGQGVRHEDTLYAKLGVKLGTPVRNVAVRGYDLEEVVSRYAYEARNPGQYEWVIYALVLDDFGLEGQGLDHKDMAPSPWRARSATINFFSHISEQWALSQDTTAAYLQSFSGMRLSSGTEKIRLLNDAVQADGARLILVIWPLLYDFDTYPFHPIHQELTSLAAELEVPTVDGFSVLSERKASSLWVHAIDHHPNEKAHELMAEAVAQKIRNIGQ